MEVFGFCFFLNYRNSRAQTPCETVENQSSRSRLNAYHGSRPSHNLYYLLIITTLKCSTEIDKVYYCATVLGVGEKYGIYLGKYRYFYAP